MKKIKKLNIEDKTKASNRGLTEPGMRKKVLKLYETLRGDESTRQQFINNPSALLGKALGLKLSTEEKVSEANRLLFSVMANPKFLEWHKEYRKTNLQLDRNKYRGDLAEALVSFGDRNILLAIINNAAVGNGLPFADMEQFSQSIFTGAASDARSSQNFAQSTGESQRPTGIELDPQLSQVLITVSDALVARAKELAQEGILSNPETLIQ